MELKRTNIIVRNANDFKNYVDYVGELEQQCKKQKEVIDKAKDYVYAHLRQNMLSDFTGANYIQEYMSEPDELLDILNEVSE